MSRYFHGLVFFVRDCRKELKLLHKRLDEAISIAGGGQQPARCLSEEKVVEEYEFAEKMEKELEDVIRDIAAALVGRNITFGDNISYPPNPSNGTKI